MISSDYPRSYHATNLISSLEINNSMNVYCKKLGTLDFAYVSLDSAIGYFYFASFYSGAVGSRFLCTST